MLHHGGSYNLEKELLSDDQNKPGGHYWVGDMICSRKERTIDAAGNVCGRPEISTKYRIGQALLYSDSSKICSRPALQECGKCLLR